LFAQKENGRTSARLSVNRRLNKIRGGTYLFYQIVVKERLRTRELEKKGPGKGNRPRSTALKNLSGNSATPSRAGFDIGKTGKRTAVRKKKKKVNGRTRELK